MTCIAANTKCASDSGPTDGARFNAGGWPIQALFRLEWGTTPIFVRLSISFHHIRTVTPITDAIPMPCENHSQIAAAKRVPGSGGGQPLFGIFRCPKHDLTNRSRKNRGSNNKKPIENP
jgi:hypothetical protein